MKNNKIYYWISCVFFFVFVGISSVFGWGVTEPVPDYFDPNKPPYLQSGSSSSSGDTSSDDTSAEESWSSWKESSGNTEHRKQNNGSSSGSSSSGSSSSGSSSSGSSSSGSSSSGSSSSTQQQADDEAAAKAAEEARLKAEAEAETARIAEEARIAAEAEAARIAEEERIKAEQAEAARIAEEERIKAEQAEAARIAEEERIKAEQAEAARIAEEERIKAEQAEAARIAEEQRQAAIKAENERKERETFSNSVAQSASKTDILKDYNKQISNIQNELIPLKQKLAYGAASMSDSDLQILINQTKALNETLNEVKETKSMLVGDPVYVATGQYADSPTDFSIKYTKKTFDITRTYTTSDSEGSFGKNWFSTLDERLIFGIWGITEEDCRKFYQNTVSVTEANLNNLKTSLTAQFGLEKESWDKVIPKIEAERNSIYDIQKSLQEQKKEAQRLCEYYTGKEYYQDMLSLYNQIVSMLSLTDDRISQYTNLISDCRETISIIKDFEAELSAEKQYYNAMISKTDENRRIRDINAPALFSGTPDYYSTAGTGTITFIDGTGKTCTFTRATQSAAKSAPESPVGTVWNADSSREYVSLTKNADGYILLYSDYSRKQFSPSGLLTRLYDAYGNWIAFERTDDGKIVSISTSCGRSFQVQYSGKYISSITVENSGRQSVSFAYTGNRLTSVTDYEGDATRYTWNSGLLSGIVKPDGSSITFSFEAVGPDRKLLTTATKNEEGFSEHFEYDFIRRTTLHTDHSGVETLYTYDADYNTTGIYYADGKTVLMDIDSDGNVTGRNCNGNITRYIYDESGRNTVIMYSDGSSEQFTYDSAGRELSYTDRTGTRFDYTRNTAGDIIEMKINGVSRMTCHYGQNGLADCESVIGDTVQTTYYEYDSRGNMTKARSADRTEEWTWDEDDNVTAYKVNGITEKEYIRQGRTLIEKDFNGLITAYTKNERKDTIRVEEIDSVTGDSRVIDYEYDKRHLVTAVWHGDCTQRDLTCRYRYDGEGRIEAIAVYRGNSTVIEQCCYKDGNGIMQSEPVSVSLFTVSPEDTERYGLTSSEGFLHANLSEVASRSDEYHSASYTTQYLPSGNVQLTVCDPCGNIVSYEYDAWGTLLSASDEFGLRQLSDGNDETAVSENQSAYDTSCSLRESRRELTVTEGHYYTTTYVLNAWGEITSVTDGNGNTTQYERDYRGNIVAIIDPYGNKTAFTYNQAGQQTATIYPDGSRLSFRYDITGNVCQVEDAYGIELIREYDAAGNIVHTAGRGMQDYDFEYDARNRICSILENGQLIWQYEYLDNGHLVKCTDAKGNAAYCRYDDDGTLLSETDRNGIVHYADTATTGSSSSAADRVTDPYGNILEISDGNAHLAFMYDDAGSLIMQKNIDTGKEVTFTYDKAGNKTSMSDGIRFVQYVYGRNNELLAVHERMNGNAVSSITFQYDSLGKETSRTWLNGETQSTTYDESGNVILSIKRNADGHLIFGEGYLYDSDGRITSKITSDGDLTLCEYDDYGRLSRVYVTDTEQTEIKERDEAEFYGLISPSSYNSVPSTSLYLSSDTYYKLQSYLNQMMNTLGNGLSVLQNVRKTEYTYDECSNRVSKTTAYGTILYGYDAENRMTSAGNHTLSYDDEGNLLTDVSPFITAEYEYSADNRMTASSISDSLQNSSKVILYGYDSLGRRVTEDRYMQMMNGTYLHTEKNITEYNGFSFDVQEIERWQYN